jgi:hypothetical protein
MFSPPYFSDRVRRLLALGWVGVAVAVFAFRQLAGGGISMALLWLYAGFYALATGEVYWAFSALRYEEHPVSYTVMVLLFLSCGTFFLVWSLFRVT